MLKAAERLSENWQAPRPGALIDATAEMTSLTLSVLALTIFSDGIGDDIDEFRAAMNAYFGAVGFTLSNSATKQLRTFSSYA